MNSITSSSDPQVSTPRSSTAGGRWAAAGPALLVGSRIGLWVAAQLLVAGLLVMSGSLRGEPPMRAAAAWWMVYGSLVDLGTLAVLIGLTRRDGLPLRALVGLRITPWGRWGAAWRCCWPACQRSWSTPG